MKRIISYSLWGDSKLYVQGAIDNFYLAKEYYSDWTVRYYIAQDCPVISKLQSLGAECVVMDSIPTLDKTRSGWEDDWQHQAMFWRFLAFGDPEAEYIISRDCDSRLSKRESTAVAEWIESGVLGHIMYECDAHYNGIMGGLNGLVGGLFTQDNIVISINNFLQNYKSLYQERWVFADLIYLRDWIFSNIQFSVMTHGHKAQKPFTVEMPSDGSLGKFIGDIVHPEWRAERWKDE